MSYYFTVQVGSDTRPRDVFVYWNPPINSSQTNSESIHKIAKLNDVHRSFEIHCCHSSLDTCNMRLQIESIINQENHEKKNN